MTKKAIHGANQDQKQLMETPMTQNCCELCRPNTLEKEQGLDSCRNTVCGCHWQEKADNNKELEIKWEEFKLYDLPLPIGAITPKANEVMLKFITEIYSLGQASAKAEVKGLVKLVKVMNGNMNKQNELSKILEEFDEKLYESHSWYEINDHISIAISKAFTLGQASAKKPLLNTLNKGEEK